MFIVKWVDAAGDEAPHGIYADREAAQAAFDAQPVTGRICGVRLREGIVTRTATGSDWQDAPGDPLASKP
jgi:hypothetical protein